MADPMCFCFGIVLYEILTGRRPFNGASDMSTLSAVLALSLPRSGGWRHSPRSGEGCSRCLSQDAGPALSGMSDMKLALEEVERRSERAAESCPPYRLPHPEMEEAALCNSIAGCSVFGAGLMRVLDRYSFSARKSPTLRFSRLTSDTGLTTDPSNLSGRQARSLFVGPGKRRKSRHMGTTDRRRTARSIDDG